jgi:TPR repeat protein
MRLFRPLAEQGSAIPQYNVGAMYENGKGVPQDFAEALKWYRLAAAQGGAGAEYNLGGMYANGKGVERNYIIAHMWFNLAAAQGVQGAERNRDGVARQMTAAQVAEAEKLAREWKPGSAIPH